MRRARGSPRRRCRDPRRSPRSWPGSPARSGCRSCSLPARPAHPRASAAREPRGDRRGAAGAGPRGSRAVHPARDRQLIEGIEGERPSASIVVLVAERSAGTPLVVEELVAARRELKHVSLTGTLARPHRGPARPPVARVPPRAAAARAVAAADGARPAGHRLGRVRGGAASANVASNLPPRSSSMPRRAADGLDADLAAGLAEAIEHGFVREEPDGRLADPPRARRAGRRHGPAAHPAPALPGGARRRRSATSRSSPRTTGGAAHRLDEARAAALEAGRLALELEAPLGRARRVRARAGAAPAAARGGAGRRAAERIAGRRRAGSGLAAGGRGGRRGRPPQPRGRLRGERPRGPRRAARPAPARGPRGAARAATGWRRATGPARPRRCGKAADVMPHGAVHRAGPRSSRCSPRSG